MPNLNKQLWLSLKGLGFFQNWASYEDWRREKYGYEKESLEDFKEELSEEDRQQFEAIFGENEKNSEKSANSPKTNEIISTENHH